jgi:CheY-like chemotaxis protein
VREVQRDFDKALRLFQASEARLAAATEERRKAEAGCDNVISRLRDVVPFDAVLLDIRLTPDRDQSADCHELTGFRLLTRLKGHFPHVPVIVVTASEKAHIARYAAERGAEAFWVKGVSTGAELRSAILRCISRAGTRDLWAKLTAVQSKPTVRCAEWDPSQLEYHDVWLTLTMPRRGDLHALLDEAFFILQYQYDVETGSALRNPWNAAVHIFI